MLNKKREDQEKPCLNFKLLVQRSIIRPQPHQIIHQGITIKKLTVENQD